MNIVVYETQVVGQKRLASLIWRRGLTGIVTIRKISPAYILSPGVIKNVVDEVCEKLQFEVTGNDKVLAVTELKQRMIVRAA